MVQQKEINGSSESEEADVTFISTSSTRNTSCSFMFNACVYCTCVSPHDVVDDAGCVVVTLKSLSCCVDTLRK